MWLKIMWVVRLTSMLAWKRGGSCVFVVFNPCKPSFLFCGTSANIAKPDQTPQNTASDQALHCLQTEVFFLKKK